MAKPLQNKSFSERYIDITKDRKFCDGINPNVACAAANKQSGWTLIELLVVVVIVGILASVAMPSFQGYMLAGRLDAAKPILLEIAAKQRILKNERGRYFSVGGNTLDEDDFINQLGIPLDEYGDFCFVFICRDNKICANANNEASSSSAKFVSDSEKRDTAIEFEVWAILRANENATSIAGPNSVKCSPSNDSGNAKRQPSGFVAEANSGDIGQESSIVVYRYPPPPNRLDAAVGIDNIKFDWNSGISISHAMLFKPKK